MSEGDFILRLTPRAASKVKSDLLKLGLPAAEPLRITVYAGGCAGMQYEMEFDDEVLEGDVTVVSDGVNILIDTFSMQYLKGTTLDYDDSLNGGWKFDNPNASGGCGCGHSFNV
jgi:iron-sulfur cluster assembly accessory protein